MQQVNKKIIKTSVALLVAFSFVFVMTPEQASSEEIENIDLQNSFVSNL